MAGSAVPPPRSPAGPPPVPPELPAEALRRAAERYGTPVYVTDVAALEAAAAELEAAFPDPWLRSYSVKANDVVEVVARLGRLGLGANVVSSGEWSIARRAGMADERVTLEGIGKTDADLRAAVASAAGGSPLGWVAVESADELAALGWLASEAGLGRGDRPPLDVLLRLNPDVAPETHAGLAVGRGSSKFGLSDEELSAASAATPDGPLRLRGIHLHVGSQLGAVDAWRDAVRRALALLGLVGAGRAAFDTLDVGGGFPVGKPGTVPSPARFAREVPPLLEGIPADRRPARLAVEPGRFLVARAGWLVASVLHVRTRDGAMPLVVIDAGMTELIRPALYGARHRIVALTSLTRPVDAGAFAGGLATRVEGPVCESTDALDVHELPLLRRGDLVAIADAGAYAASMAMTYNGRPRPPQLLLERDGRLVLARRRGAAGPGLG